MAVFHLKYRPKNISELDLTDVRQTLEKMLSSKDMPQAFLFTGPKGSGKTSAARAVARAINCLEPKGVESCEKCENCRTILEGSSLDLIEIDAASNRGIEDVRVLKENAYLLPTKLKKKVFIIDEVHMLTKEAFNALLKLIEEPPEHCVFILCTTEPEKIPETVMSRLSVVNFRKGKDDELKSSLQRVIEGEELKISQEAIDLIVEKSDGSFRNLQKSLQEIYLQKGSDIKEEDVADYYADKGGDYSEGEFEEDLYTKDTKKMLVKMESMADSGVDFKLFRERLVAHFQKRILSFFGVEEKKGKLPLADIKKILRLLVEAGRDEKEVSVEQLPLELAIVEFMGENIDDGNGKEDKTNPKIEKTVEKKKAEEKKEENKPEEEKQEEKIVTGDKLELETIEKGWGKILVAVKPYNHSVEAFLRATRPKSVEGSVVTLEVFYPFHKERLEEAKNRAIVEKGFREVLGGDYEFRCVLGKLKKEPFGVAKFEVDKVMESAVLETKEKDIYDTAKEIFG